MAKITLENGGYAICDDCDEHWLSRFKWHSRSSERAHSEYAATFIGNSMIYMHRLVVGTCGKGLVADHIDHNGLNNRRDNLRVCHYTQNAAYSVKIKKKGATKFKGVRSRRSGRWGAEVRRGGKILSFGTHATPEDAARAYDENISKIDGPFAMTNASMGLL
jgi:hypothetical protein